MNFSEVPFLFIWNQLSIWDLDHVFGWEGIQVSSVLVAPLIVDNWADRSVGRRELRDNGGSVALFMLFNHHWQLGINYF